MGRFEVFLCFWEVLAPFSGMVACTELFPVPCTELFPVHRAFSCAQSFFLCAELFPVHRAFSCAQSFLPCTELSVVHRAFRCAQSFLLCTELSAVHRALFWQPLQPWFVKETAVFLCKGTKAAKSCAFCDCTPEFYGGILFLLLEKQGKLYFLQSSQTKGRGVLLRLETPVLSAALCKSSRILQSRILGQYVGFRLGMFFRL